MKKAEVYNISTDQYPYSSGLLGKTTNIRICKIIMANIDALPVVTPKPQFQNTFSPIATLFLICRLSQLKHLDMNEIVLGKFVRRTSFIKPKPSSLWELGTNVTNNNHCVMFVFFSVYFS